jgi:hypothetical protein
MTAWLACSACDSGRTTRDDETERDLERVLSSQFETSLDAGVAREAALEASLARRLEVTDARLIEWAGAPAATVTSPDETSQHVEVADGAQAKRLIDELFARGAQVDSFKWKADGVTVVLSRSRPSSASAFWVGCRRASRASASGRRRWRTRTPTSTTPPRGW